MEAASIGGRGLPAERDGWRGCEAPEDVCPVGSITDGEMQAG